MNKTALKNFAIYSREKLIKDIEDKARLIGIREEGIDDPLPQSTKDMKIFSIGEKDTYRIDGEDVKKYEILIKELEKRQEEGDYSTAYNTLIEEVAYTWFNRIIAIRFMEVNNYMPDRMRVLSSGREGVREPEFVTHYRNTDIGIREEEFKNLDRLKLDGSAKAMEELFQILFIKQSNALNTNLPELFEKTDDYAELLLNISYEDPQGVVRKLIEDIGEEPFNISESGQIEIIGWLYQYYNTVPKAEVDAANKKVDKNTLPHKTQLFTPEWIVKYMVQNSLGRLWIERKLAIGSDKTEKELAKEYGWKYYLPEAEQIEEVKIKLKTIREDRKELKIEDITFIDPSMGSGHILVYAFEMFMQFYLEEGYMEREAAESIIENNLYGLDIDKRAYQLAYFSLMMKGRQYSRRILNKEIRNNLYYFIDSKDINLKQIDLLGGNIKDKHTREDIKQDILEIVELFKNGRELGSIIKAEKDYNYEVLSNFAKSINNIDTLPMDLIGIENTQEDIIHILNLLEILSNKYNIVVTNPPYLGRRSMGVNLTKYLDKQYPDTKADLFAVFMEKCNELLIPNGYYGMINQHSWMFLSSFEKYRERLLLDNNLTNMLHLGPRAFEEIGGEVVQSTTFIVKKNKIKDYVGSYTRLIDFKNAQDKEYKTLEAIENPECGYYYDTNEDNFAKIPGMPIAYWASENFLNIYSKSKSISEVAVACVGLQTSDNNRFIRLWHEVFISKIGFHSSSNIEAIKTQKKWFPYNKGGGFKRWYGNREYIVNWENDGAEIREYNNFLNSSRTSNIGIANTQYYFKESGSWGLVSSSQFSVRFTPKGSIFDTGGSSVFGGKNIKYIIGLLNSKVSTLCLQVQNPTLNFQPGNVGKIPYVTISENKRTIDLINSSIEISRTDWDTFETSWDFKVSPLANFNKYMDNYYDSLIEIGIIPERKQFYISNLEEAYGHYKDFTNTQFDQLKTNEEELNRIFIEIYGLEDELTPQVSDKDITIAKIFDDKKDIYEDIKGNAYILTKEDVIKSFISYGVGCIFGRYSLDERGLVYAGGEFDNNRYDKFKPVEDNIVLITDEEYFEDDLVNRFIDFVRTSFGEENLEENLKFIADSLKGKGTPREKIRNYFLNDFYEDHVRRYQKTPIYWLYDSSAGKTKTQSQNGFKALIYMHRYNSDTTGKVRIDYLHKLQRIYERRIDFLRDDIAHNKDAKNVAKSEKELEKIIKQVKECKDYDEKIGHIALSRIDIDLDDGVKVNYEKAQIDDKGKKFKILAKI